MISECCWIGRIHCPIPSLFTARLYQLWQHERFQFATTHLFTPQQSFVVLEKEEEGRHCVWYKDALSVLSV